jgi:RNA polymerase sigma-70 factor (ECF subfamily)
VSTPTHTHPTRDRAVDLNDQAALLFDAFALHRHTLYAIARRLVGPDLAADVVQEVITRAWSHRDRYDPARGSMRAYLVTMTRGTSIDLIRRMSSQRARDERHRSTSITWDETNELHELIRDQEALRVSAALDVLTPDERALIVTAFYGADVTYRQLAMDFDLPEGTVKSRIRSALHKLRCALADLRTEQD